MSGSDSTASPETLETACRAFVAHYRQNGGCSHCGGMPHSTTCFVGRVERALAGAPCQPVLLSAIERMDGWHVDDPFSPFVGEEVVSRAQVLAALSKARELGGFEAARLVQYALDRVESILRCQTPDRCGQCAKMAFAAKERLNAALSELAPAADVLTPTSLDAFLQAAGHYYDDLQAKVSDGQPILFTRSVLVHWLATFAAQQVVRHQ